MPVGLSFGSATSGNGFDVTSTVSSIMAIERTPETAWATRTTALQAQDTVLSTLGTNVSAMSTALSSLTSFDGVFASKQGASSDTGSVALTSVGSTAAVGTHSLTVQSLATTAQQHSNALATGATLSGTLSLQLAGSASATVLNVQAGSTLTGVAAQINASGAGVNATVLADSSGQHLSLTSKISGAQGDLSVNASLQDSGGNAVSFTTSQSGTDAHYKLDGVSLTSGTNAISTALNGVAFQLTGMTDSAVTLEIAPDSNSIVTALQSFVSAYNTLSSSLSAQEGKDSGGNALPLFGSTVVSEIQSGLSSAFAFFPADSASGLSLAALGLSLSQTGTLALDTSTLSNTLNSNFDGASATFWNTNGFGQHMSSTLTGMGSTGAGTIALALNNNSQEESTLAANKTALESRLSSYQTRLTAELNTANEILQAIPQQLNEVNQMFYAISGYKSS